ncbi:MAG: hypothetical protein ACREOC_04910 [Gemmatimonadales bacterium]
MSGMVGLDVRLPIGGLFTVLGLILAGYGFATTDDAANYERSLSVNVNLWWGLVILVFGLALLLGAGLGRRRAAVRPAAETLEGRATEEREHRTGLER